MKTLNGILDTAAALLLSLTTVSAQAEGPAPTSGTIAVSDTTAVVIDADSAAAVFPDITIETLSQNFSLTTDYAPLFPTRSGP